MRARIFIVLTFGVLQACWMGKFQKKSVDPVPATTTPRPMPPITASAPPQDPVIDAPTVPVPAESPSEIQLPEAPQVTTPRPSARRGSENGASAQKKPAAPQAQPVPAPATVPRLGEILSPEIRASYERDYVAHVSRAQDMLTQAAGKNLDSNQEQTVDRIRTFLRQSQDLREGGDLTTAVEVARRAALLAEDLGRTFR